MGGEAGAVEAEAEGEHAEDGLGVGESEECVVIVGVAGGESADRGRVRLGALGRVGEARVCAKKGWSEPQEEGSKHNPCERLETEGWGMGRLE